MSEPQEQPSTPPNEPGKGFSGDAMSCEQARRQVERFIEDNDLKETERVLLAAHVKTCAACRTILEQARRIEVRLKDTFSALETRPDFNRRLNEALAATQMQPAPPDMIKPKPAAPAPTPAREKLSRKVPDYVDELTEATVTGSAEPGDVPTRRVETGAHAGTLSLSSRLWSLRLPLVALLLIGVGVYYLQPGPGLNVSELPPLVLVASAGGTINKDNSVSMGLTGGHVLEPNQTLTAGDRPLTITLSSNNESLARVVLSPGTQLRAQNRHVYTVLSGSAYFQVYKERPKASGEYFDVHAAELGMVRVTGTAFVVDMAAQEGALVAVEEGIVEVRQTIGGTISVRKDEELVLGAGKQVRRTNIGTRLAWMNPPTVAPPAPNTGVAGGGVVIKQPLQPQPAKARFDWDTPVGTLSLYGRSLADGVQAVADKVDSPRELIELVEHARKFANPVTLSFSICSPMSVREAIAWMARDVGLRLEVNAAGSGSFRTAGADQPIGPALEGSLPAEVVAALNADVLGDTLAGADTLPVFARQLGGACGLTIVCARELWDRFDHVLNAPGPGMRPADSILRDLVRRAGANIAWYDHVLYVAPAARIEALTTVDRATPPLASLIGMPRQASWERDLKTILERCTYPAPQLTGGPFTDAHLAEKPAFADLRSDTDRAGGPCFLYRSGLSGQALMQEMLKSLSVGSQQVAGAAGVLSQHSSGGAIADVETLVSQAREFLAVESRVKATPFARGAFVNKTLSLGDALEWGAWLSGNGLRQENNVLIVDEFDVCYGPAQWQVLAMQTFCDRHRDMSVALPARVAALLPAMYPTFFPEPRAIYCVQSAVVFMGDRRQLRVAQRMLTDLELAVDGPHTNIPFELQTWRPLWRTEMEKKLSEPFRSNGSDKLTGTFAWLLRQSVLSSQIHCTVLVDPAFMKDHCSDEVKNLDVTNLTVAQVLERLAARVGLKMVIEGDVVWLKP